MTYHILDIDGDPEANDIEIVARRRASRFIVTDTLPIQIDESGAGRSQRCRLVNATKARCKGPSRSSLVVEAKEGDDRVAVAGRVDAMLSGDVGDDLLRGRRGSGLFLAGDGNDRAFGGRGRDYFEESRGDDVLRGGRGRDHLNEGFHRWGSDSLFGGRGADQLRAHDRVTDQHIDCGPGRKDREWIDAALDPKPRRCEEVERRA